MHDIATFICLPSHSLLTCLATEYAFTYTVFPLKCIAMEDGLEDGVGLNRRGMGVATEPELEMKSADLASIISNRLVCFGCNLFCLGPSSTHPPIPFCFSYI
jgi:hypothetical protein